MKKQCNKCGKLKKEQDLITNISKSDAKEWKLKKGDNICYDCTTDWVEGVVKEVFGIKK